MKENNRHRQGQAGHDPVKLVMSRLFIYVPFEIFF